MLDLYDFFGLHVWVDYNIHIDESHFIDNSQIGGGEIVFLSLTFLADPFAYVNVFSDFIAR